MIRLGPLIGEMPVVGGITAYFNEPWSSGLQWSKTFRRSFRAAGARRWQLRHGACHGEEFLGHPKRMHQFFQMRRIDRGFDCR